MGSSQSNSATLGESDTTNTDTKMSLYQRYQEKKRGPGLSEEDIKKYTGKNRDELAAWADTRPGVGKNQLAGKIGVGPTSGLGGAAAAGGRGGWGMGAEPGNSETRGMKFPPEKAEKKLDDSE